jgi:hypothetical protein
MKVRRIVATLQPQRPARERVAAIADLARRMEAELLGLFIEDIELLHFAALPFAHELGGASAVRRQIDVDAMERVMRARAEELRTALVEALDAAPVQWTFRIERGLVPRQVLAAGIEQPGTLLLPPGVDVDEEIEAIAADDLTEARLRELLRGTRPVLILPGGAAAPEGLDAHQPLVRARG